MLKINNLYFGYNKAPLCIKEFNLELKLGEKVLILGGEGMGKTSLLKVIAGLEKQYVGEIFIDNKNLKNIIHEKRSVSFLPSEPVLLNGTILDNLKFLFKTENVFYSEEELLSVFNLFDFNYSLKAKVNKMPVVDKKIFAIIRAYLKGSKLLLIDNQTDNVGDKNIIKIKNAINTIINDKSNKKCVIMVENLINNVEFNKKIYMSYSKTITYNSLTEIKDNPEDYFVFKYFDYAETSMVLRCKNDEFYLSEYGEYFDKKRKKYEIILKNTIKIRKNKINNAENYVLADAEYVKVKVVYLDDYIFDNDVKFNEKLKNSIFVFDAITGDRIV